MMQFDFTVPDEAFAAKYRDRLHTLLQNTLTQNLFALERHDIESTKVIRRGMDETAVRQYQDKLEKRRAKHLADFGTLQGFQE
jgi:hypothetical protein